MVRVLCRRTKNNPVLIGEPGVGKVCEHSVHASFSVGYQCLSTSAQSSDGRFQCGTMGCPLSAIWNVLTKSLETTGLLTAADLTTC
jgi:hypothetical protein